MVSTHGSIRQRQKPLEWLFTLQLLMLRSDEQLYVDLRTCAADAVNPAAATGLEKKFSCFNEFNGTGLIQLENAREG